MIKIKKKIILAAGGTGGHLYGAISLSEELKLKGYKVFLFTDKRVESLVKNFDIKNIKIIPSGTFTNTKFFYWPISFFKIISGIFLSLFYMTSIRPSLVIGFGGYPTIPILISAKISKIKIIIHEQNSIIGRANKLLIMICDKITTGFQKTIGVNNRYSHKTIYTGNPVRSEIFKYKKEYKKRNKNETFNLLIFGGSQGASFFSDMIPLSINKLVKEKKSLLHVFHQVREGQVDKVKSYYDSKNIKSDVKTFFFNLPKLLNNSHLLISRAGASTVSEVYATKIPAIFIPLPHSIDNDQELNTKELEKIGQVIVKKQKNIDSSILFKMLDKFIEEPEVLEIMARSNKKNYINDSSKKIVSLVDKIIQNERD